MKNICILTRDMHPIAESTWRLCCGHSMASYLTPATVRPVASTLQIPALPSFSREAIFREPLFRHGLSDSRVPIQLPPTTGVGLNVWQCSGVAFSEVVSVAFSASSIGFLISSQIDWLVREYEGGDKLKLLRGNLKVPLNDGFINGPGEKRSDLNVFPFVFASGEIGLFCLLKGLDWSWRWYIETPTAAKFVHMARFFFAEF